MWTGAAWAGVTCLVTMLVGILSGAMVPGSMYRDMRRERDLYREAAQRCSETVVTVQQQNDAMMAVLNQQRNGVHENGTGR